VSFHLVAITLSALPSPEGGMNRAAWKDPTVQAEFASWADRFGMDPQDFEDRLWVFADVYGRGYKRLLAPVAPYEDLVGCEQSWKMFVAPHRFPTRLELAVRTAGAPWEVIFSEGSPTATWNAPVLRLERLRSAIFRWGWPSYQSAWGHGCTALARQIFSERDDATDVRCRFWKYRTASPEEALAGTVPDGKWLYTRLVSRGPDGLPVASTTSPAGAGDDASAAPPGVAPASADAAAAPLAAPLSPASPGPSPASAP
jgi:hypothetical protein